MKLNFGKLEFIVFASGTIVMILELIGSRLLAPFLGTSIFVWTALIGIILGALSLGYYLGGRLSAKNSNLDRLTLILFFAGVSIFLISIFKNEILGIATLIGVKWGSVLASAFLFGAPSVLLGMVSPYSVRLKINNLESAGGVAGNLYALSTIGSIFGTFLAGFYLIPLFGSTQIIFGLSLTLLLISLLGQKKLLKIIILFIVFITWLFFQFLPNKYVYETDSAYNHIIVRDVFDQLTSRDIRILYLATETQSIIYKNSDQLFSVYHQLYALDDLFKSKIEKALTLGGGAYVAPLNFLKRYPQAEMDVVEIDPKVTQTAIDYFGLKPDPRLNIIHQDGRIFLNQNQKQYDVIYGDAFASYYSIPFQLTTTQAIKKIYNTLNSDGILILNVISSLEGKGSLFFQAEYLTLKQIFPQVYIFPTHFYRNFGLDNHQNLILIATKSEKRLTKQELMAKADADQKKLLDHFWDQEPKIDAKAKILTDEFAPVDNYIAQLID